MSAWNVGQFVRCPAQTSKNVELAHCMSESVVKSFVDFRREKRRIFIFVRVTHTKCNENLKLDQLASSVGAGAVINFLTT